MNFDISSQIKDSLLNGSNGHFRAIKSQKHTEADTDHDAIQAFLAEYQSSPATLRTYTKECGRLLIWAVLHLGKPLSSMTRDDFTVYIDFLRNPHPDWCGNKVSKKLESWRPFTGPLSNSAIRTSLASINSLFGWLVNAGYVTGNPLGLIRKKIKNESAPSQYKKVERFLDDDMWAALLSCVETMPAQNKSDKYQQERMRFMLSLLALLGPRISELSNIKMNDFHRTVAGWFWQVTGKGDKDASVAMPQDMVEALMRWRRYLGLSSLPKTSENVPAMPFVSKSSNPILNKPGIGPRRINQILKVFFEKAAVELDLGGQKDKAEIIKSASAHWLRHTSITQKVNAGIDKDIVQMEARHSDARTTAMYTHDEEKERSKQAQKHKINWAK